MADEPRQSLTLKVPIVIGSETITELRFRAPKAKDFRTMPMDGQTVGHILDMMGKLCGQPNVVMDELSLEDLEEVSSLFYRFTSRGGASTGSMPSR
jgi:hypothetical protein